MKASLVAGIALFGSGVAMLAISIPVLMTNPEFLAYSYLDTDNEYVKWMVQLMAFGSMLVAFGLILVSKGRKTKVKLVKGERE
jgi:hypothetical protein